MQTGIALAGLMLLLLIAGGETILRIRAFQRRPPRLNLMKDAELDTEALAVHLRHTALIARGKGAARLRLPHGMARRLRMAAKLLSRLPREELLPAAQWLSDNLRMLEETIDSAKRELKRAAPLPKSLGGQPVVFRLCQEYISHTSALFTKDGFIKAVRAWQSEAPLSQLELWSLPLALKTCLLTLVNQMIQAVLSLQKDSMKAPKWAAMLTGRRRDRARRAFGRAPESTAFLERLLSCLKETEDGGAFAWLDQQLAQLDLNAGQIVEREHARQTGDRLWMGNAITSLMMEGRVPWREVTEEMNPVHFIFQGDPTGTYPLMDFESREYYCRRVQRFARAARLPESMAAQGAVALASRGKEEITRHIGYYLIETAGQEALARYLGVKKLRVRLCLLIKRHARGLFSAYLWLAALIGFESAFLLRLPGVFVLPFMALASQCARWLFKSLVLPRLPRRMLPRMEMKELTPKEKTLVVCPTLLTSVHQAMGMARQLSILRHANPDPLIHFMLLGDFADSLTAEQVSDREILAAAQAGVEALCQETGEGVFYLQRGRTYNAREKKYMGRERKRGALETLNRILTGGETEDAFLYASCPPQALAHEYAYVITLDSDTRMPPGSAMRLIGAMAHPMQKRVKANGVWRGVSLIQPRMEVAADTVKSRISLLYGGPGGVDPYNASMGDAYQDLYGAGSFAGKGIYTPDTFREATEGLIAGNSVLSHDLLEGELSGCALAEDIVLYDGHPKTMEGWMKRLHRWTRGDWQLLPWLTPFIPGSPQPRRNPLKLFSRHKIWDNLLRSLVPLCQLALILYAAAAGRPWLFLLILLLPDLNIIFRPSLNGLYARLVQWASLPYTAFTMADAIGRTLFRLLVSHKNMLQWVTAAQAESAKESAYPPGSLCQWAASLILLAASLAGQAALIPGLTAAVLFAAFPLILPFLNGPVYPEPVLSPQRQSQLMETAKNTWRFFQVTVTQEDHFLPPDNLQLEPDKGLAHRTSPTNIGFYLLSLAAAREMGFIDADEMGRRMEKTVAVMEKLPLWKGHLFNWYDTRTLEPMPPMYVSSVDSGNLCACLLCCAQAVRTLAPQMDAALYSLSARLDSLAMAMDLSALFDESAQLFHIGMDVKEDRLSAGHYDLLASEARLLSFVAVMTRQVPIRHWYRMGRTLVKTSGGPALVSWSGTMFEYLMPHVLLPLTRGTLLDQSLRHAVLCQRRHVLHGLWGVSESGYYAFDPQLNYLYKAFGLPALALGSEAGDQVIAPYACGLCLPLYPEAASDNLARMRAMGLEGRLGFYEAADFDPARAPQDKTCGIVFSHMAHHQGMLFCALCNALTGQALNKYFAALPAFQAYSLLLEEKMPKYAFKRKLPLPRPAQQAALPALSAHRAARVLSFPIDAHLVYGGGSTLMTDAQGNGYMAREGTFLSRFTGQAGDDCGIRFYLREGADDTLTQLTDPTVPGKTAFSTGKAVYTRSIGQMETSLTCTVNPIDGAFVHLIELNNPTGRERLIEVASYFEISLAGQKADQAHPAFRDLFVETFRVGKRGLAARRRPRDGRDDLRCLTHAVACDTELIHILPQTDRSAFLGRNGSVQSPRQLQEGIAKAAPKVGAVIHPCMSLTAQFLLPPHGRARLLFATVLEDEERLPPQGVLDRYAHPDDGLRAMDLALTQGLVTARYLSLGPKLQNLYGQAVGALLYGGQPHSFTDLSPCPMGKEGLWSLGVSGDLPIFLVVLSHQDHLALAKSCLDAHAMYHMQGFWVDLVFLVKQAASYDQPLYAGLQELCASSLSRDRMGKPGGAHLMDGPALDSRAELLLRHAARLTMEGEAGAFAAQWQRLARPWALPGCVPAFEEASGEAERTDQELMFFNGYGGFAPQEGSYVISLPPSGETPAPWCNYANTPSFGSLLSESGPVFTYAGNSHHGRLTRWPNDPVAPVPGEGIAVTNLDTGITCSPTRYPFGRALAVRAEHSPGATVYTALGQGMQQTLTVFADREMDVSCRSLRIRNMGKETLRLRVSHYADFVLGEGPQDSAYVSLSYEEEGLIALSPSVPGAAFLALLEEGEQEASILSSALLKGLYGPRPAALLNESVFFSQPGSAGILSKTISIEPGQSAAVTFLLGLAPSLAGLKTWLAAFRAEGVTARLRKVRAYWIQELSTLTFQLPMEEMNLMMNLWLPYQVRCARLFARAGFYQAGGAIGFRDQLQDMLALMYSRPEKVRAHLIDCAAHQFVEGDVQHWWHPPRLGVRTRISDDLLFLPYVAAHYIRKTGDQAILSQPVPYLYGPKIPEGQEDWYGSPGVTKEQEPFLDHCLKAIRHVELGSHSLPLMKGGDWNDGMNHVGGKTGESVWLGFFLCAVLRDFAPLCPEDARQELMDLRDKVLKGASEAAWDGSWYLRAWYDNGQPLGTSAAASCQIDNLSQSWAVLAGAPRNLAIKAMDSAYTRLFHRDVGVMQLLDPPFNPPDRPGYIAGYLTGIRENGGQYTHAVPWFIWAMKELGWTDRAWEMARAVVPINHALTPQEARRYRVEPYAMAGDVYMNPDQRGRGGWSWYTGSAAWLYVVVLEQLLGFQKNGNSVRLSPRVPEDWPEFSITYQFGRSTYHLTASKEVLYPTLDGEKTDGPDIALNDDGRIHEARFPIK